MLWMGKDRDQSIKAALAVVGVSLRPGSHVAGTLWFPSPACWHTCKPSVSFLQEHDHPLAYVQEEVFKNQPKLKTASCLIYTDTLLEALYALAQ